MNLNIKSLVDSAVFRRKIFENFIANLAGYVAIYTVYCVLRKGKEAVR